MLEQQIKHYKTIAEKLGFQNQNLSSCYLNVKPERINYTDSKGIEAAYENLMNILNPLIENVIDQGWARSQKAIHSPWPNDSRRLPLPYAESTHGYLFEGEWVADQQTSIHLRQIHKGWAITEFKEVTQASEAITAEPFLYQDHYALTDKPKSQTQKYIKHRVYHQLIDESYQASFSRFLGFTTSNDTTKGEQ